MSCRVLVLGEDTTNDGKILKPIVERLMEEAGRPNATVVVPNFATPCGFSAAVKRLRSDDLMKMYGHFDLWLFFPDADLGTTEALSKLEQEVRPSRAKLFCAAAMPEVEIWALAGCFSQTGLSWQTLRDHPKLKEEVFEPLTKERKLDRLPGGGRKEMVMESLANWRGLLEKCSELKELLERLKQHLP